MQTASTVEVERHDGWAVVRLAREAKRNALDRASRASLMAAFESLSSGVRAVVVTGSGASFCAGLDLKERAADQAAGRGEAGAAEWVALNMAIREHPAVFIAAVNGLALGGGVTLLNSCDLALASEDAALACPELGFATYASGAGPTTLLSGVARKRAAWLLLTTERLDARTAERWGLVNEVLAPAALLPRAQTLAARISGFDAVALAEAKRTLDQVPAVHTGWRAAMAFGQTVNATIRRRKALQGA